MRPDVTKVRVDAWFYGCHKYNKMKIVDVKIPPGTIYKSTETCKDCGKTQQVDVRADYWGVEKK